MSFNPETFLDATFTESNSTELAPVQPGEYIASVKSVAIKQGDKKDGSGKWAQLQVAFTIDDPVVQEELQRVPVVYYSPFLDLTDDGNLDTAKGRNINIGRLRAALDLNQQGQEFTFKMMEGRQAKVKVEHRIVKEKPMAEVKSVVKPY